MKHIWILAVIFVACNTESTVEPEQSQETKNTVSSSIEKVSSSPDGSSSSSAIVSEVKPVSQSSVAFSSSSNEDKSSALSSSVDQKSSEILSSSSETIFKTTTLKEGTFKPTDVQTTGSWRIEKRKDGLYLVLGSDFKSTAGPDLFLVISKRSNTDFTNTNFSSIPEADRLILGNVFTGTYAGQERKIPVNDSEIGAYKTILFQCVHYSHTFGKAEIR